MLNLFRGPVETLVMVGPRMSQGLHQRQEMLLQPRMLQAIEVLQLSNLELEAFLHQAMQENEALVPSGPGTGESVEPGAPPMGAGARAQAGEATRRHDEFLQNQPERERGLHQVLEDQLSMLGIEGQQLEWVRFLAGCLDDNGYLSLPDERLLELANELELDGGVDELGPAIARLQRLEPRGIGGRDLVEAVLLQLDPKDGDYPLLCRLLEECLDDLARNKKPAVARKLGIELEDLDLLLEVLRELDPRPGASVVDIAAPVLEPDVVVEACEGGLEVRVERSRWPAVAISEEVRDLVRQRETDTSVKKHLRERIEEARWIVDAVEQRQRTLLRIARMVFGRQRAFLENGPGHLVPLQMSQVAEWLSLHVSTVSRAVSGKVAQTPQGIFPLRHFFQAGGATDGELAHDEVAAAVKAVFDEEDPKAPLSDDEARAALSKRGIEVARRTVAKYRRQLGIGSSYRRREY